MGQAPGPTMEGYGPRVKGKVRYGLGWGRSVYGALFVVSLVGLGCIRLVWTQRPVFGFFSFLKLGWGSATRPLDLVWVVLDSTVHGHWGYLQMSNLGLENPTP